MTSRFMGVALHRAVIVIAALSCCPGARAQFSKIYSVNVGNSASDVARVPDGGYVVIGGTSDDNGRNPEPMIMKLDALGVVQWSYRYDTSEGFGLDRVAVQPDGSIGVSARLRDLFGTTRIAFLRLDSSGNVLSSRTVTEGLPQAITTTLDGCYVIADSSRLMKLDANGNVVWLRRYRDATFGDITCLPDGRLACAGFGWNTRRDVPGCLVTILTTDGDVDWHSVHAPLPGGRDAGINHFIAARADGDLHVAVSARDSGDQAAVWTFRIRPGVGVLWSRWLEALYYGQPGGIGVLADGSVAVSAIGGWRNRSTTFQDGLWLIGMSEDGDVRWQRVPVGVSSLLGATAGHPPGGLVIVGNRSFGADLQAVVTQLADDGWTTSGCASLYDVSGTVEEVPPCELESTLPTWYSIATDIRDFVVTRRNGPVEVPCTDRPCFAMNCLGVSQDPGSVPGRVGLRLIHEGGFGAVSVAWDVDGDTVTDADGNPVWVDLPVGAHSVTATAVDSCTSPGATTCTVTRDVTVSSVAPWEFSEVSDVLAGDPPLLVTADALEFEQEPNAAAYHLYVDRIGSWYAPTDMTGRTCGRRDWSSNGDGTVAITMTLPPNSWIEVTAADACSEGPLGRDSLGRPRDTGLPWSRCGASP